MHPVLLHRCAVCNTDSSVPFSASIFSEPQYCRNCSAVSDRISVPPAKTGDMQQDELAALFAQQMSFAPVLAVPTSQPTPPPEPQSDRQRQPADSHLCSPEPMQRASSEPITYISAHYTHSSHVRASQISPPASHPSSSPPINPQFAGSDLENVLLQHSIDPALLVPAQLNLFQSANTDQRLRLLELWRICPPTIQERDRRWESGQWATNTSLRMEEDAARLRWEDREQARQQQHMREIDLQQREKQRQREEWARQDPHFRDPMDDDETDEGNIALYVSSSSPAPIHKQAEPYMVSGYEFLARRDYEHQPRGREAEEPLQETTRYNQAVDPAFNRVLWNKGQVDMENQYGRAMGFAAHEDDEMAM